MSQARCTFELTAGLVAMEQLHITIMLSVLTAVRFDM
jgi:hypothetical protein